MPRPWTSLSSPAVLPQQECKGAGEGWFHRPAFPAPFNGCFLSSEAEFHYGPERICDAAYVTEITFQSDKIIGSQKERRT
jgi:hypothetical protein